MAIGTFNVMTTEFCLGSFVVVTLVASIAAAVTYYRQRRLLGFAKDGDARHAAAVAANPDHGDDRIENSIMPGRWSTHRNDDEVESSDEVRRASDRDPLEFCEHIPGEMKRVKQRIAEKKVQEEMTEDQREMERQVKEQQMEAIFNLLKEQEDKFGIASVDDMDRQMTAYYNL